MSSKEVIHARDAGLGGSWPVLPRCKDVTTRKINRGLPTLSTTYKPLTTWTEHDALVSYFEKWTNNHK